MTTLKWAESVPSNASLVGNAPVDFKSVWTSIALGMATEHFYPGSGGGSDASAGILRPGGSKCFVGNRSDSSVQNSQYTGRLFLDRTNSRLYAYDSAGTYLVGTSWYEEMATDAGGTAYWARSAGAVASVPTGSSTTVVALPLTYGAAPRIVITSSNASWYFCLVTSTTTNFTSCFSTLAGASGTATLNWQSLGTLSGVSY